MPQLEAAKIAISKFFIWKYPIRGISSIKIFESTAILTICLSSLYSLCKIFIFPEFVPIVIFFIFLLFAIFFIILNYLFVSSVMIFDFLLSNFSNKYILELK